MKEMEEMREEAAHSETGVTVREFLRKRRYRQPIILVLIINLGSQLSGFNAVGVSIENHAWMSVIVIFDLNLYVFQNTTYFWGYIEISIMEPSFCIFLSNTVSILDASGVTKYNITHYNQWRCLHLLPGSNLMPCSIYGVLTQSLNDF